MPDLIVVADNVLIPADAIEMRVSRSSGPGGQNVNKVSSKVELHVRLSSITGLTQAAYQRLQSQTRNRLDCDGHLLVISQMTRDQLKNIADARDKVRAIVARALIEPVIRRPTRPTKGSVERRLTDKRRTSQTKANRSRKAHQD
jgi:ribosome-associated protein